MVRGPQLLRFVCICLCLFSQALGHYRRLYRKYKLSIDVFERSARIYMEMVATINMEERKVQNLTAIIEQWLESNSNSVIDYEEYGDLVDRRRRTEALLIAHHWKLTEMKAEMKECFDDILCILLDYYYSLHSSLSKKHIAYCATNDLVRLSRINASLAYFEQVINLIHELMVFQWETCSSTQEEESSEESRAQFTIFS